MSTPETISDDDYALVARKKYEAEGHLRMEKPPKVKRANERAGAYVEAWLWVNDSDVKEFYY